MIPMHINPEVKAHLVKNVLVRQMTVYTPGHFLMGCVIPVFVGRIHHRTVGAGARRTGDRIEQRADP